MAFSRISFLWAITVLYGITESVHALSYDGEIALPDTAGGLFGAITDMGDPDPSAWFGVDGYPAKIIRVRLGIAKIGNGPEFEGGGGSADSLVAMEEMGRFELNKAEERLWSLVAEERDPSSASWYAYAGVGNPPGRLVKVDLLQMKRVGYVDITDKDIRGSVVIGEHAYFVTDSKPATVLRCPTKEMFHGDTFSPMEVSLALGEHNVQAVLPSSDRTSLILGTYTQPARIVKLSVPSMTRSASLTLPKSDEMIYAGAMWGNFAVFGTSTLPGRVIKVDVVSMSHVKTVELQPGEDRAVTLVVYSGKAFVGLANEWEQDTSSVVQVDLETMREEAAIVTPPGCTWLYAATINRGFAFFGSRYHETSVIARMNLRVAKPDVPRAPTGNATGQDAVVLSWGRDFPRYHTGGAEVVGARVLVRPAWHWDWTAEHVYGLAAPDPYAPTEGPGRIIRVHEKAADLLAGGYGAIVDGLDPMEAYKFAVILSNSAGNSHRSRSSPSITTSFSARLELLLLAFGIVVELMLGAAWCWAYRGGSGGAHYGAVPGLMKGGHEEDDEDGEDEGEGRGWMGAGVQGGWWLREKLAQPCLMGEPYLMLSCAAGFLVFALPGQVVFDAYLRAPAQLEDTLSMILSAFLLTFLAALTWALSAVFWAIQKGVPERGRGWAVVGSAALWGAMVGAMAMLMAWSGSRPSPHGSAVASSVTWQYLLLFCCAAGGEVWLSISEQKRSGIARAASLPEWVMAL